MNRLKTIVFVLLLLFAISAGLIVFAPAVLITPIAGLYLNNLGIRVVDLEQLQLGLGTSSVAGVTIESNGLTLSAVDMAAHYTLSELLQGRLQKLTIRQLGVEVSAAQASGSSTENPQAPQSILQLLEQIPIAEIQIAELNIAPYTVQFDLQMQTQPVRISGSASLGPTLVEQWGPDWEQDWTVEWNAESADSSSLLGKLLLLKDGEAAADMEFEIDFQEQSVGIEASSTFYQSLLQNSPALQKRLAPYVVLTASLSLHSQFSIDNLLGDATIPEIILLLDSPDSLLQLGQRTPAQQETIIVQLPLTLTGSARSFATGFEFTSNPVHFSVVHDSTDYAFDVDTILSNLTLRCENTDNCSAGVDLEILNGDFQYGELEGEELALRGAVKLEYTDRQLELSAPSLELSLPRLQTPGASTSLNFSLQQLRLIVAEQLRGTFSFSSNEIKLGLENIALNKPALLGELRLLGDTVDGTLEFSVNNQLRLNVILQHDLSENTGFADIELPAYGFSSLTPLSSLLEQSLVNLDIVAGQVAGQGELTWQRSAQSWEIEGPMLLTADSFSGYYEEFFFIDLSTQLAAELASPFTLRSEDQLSATIARVDVGIPLSNIEWRYTFDSAGKQFAIDRLTMDVLGGRVSVAEFDYSAEQEASEFAVVLTGLNLQPLVSLAKYPGLAVDGLISGYLPLTLRDEKIIIEEGLVSALKPGGSIRYTPSNPVPSSNSGVRLVNDALSNYQYKTLDSHVYYDENGELRLEVQLRGTNPDMNNGQAIDLNVTITDNIPMLMRSIQASRIITDALERALTR